MKHFNLILGFALTLLTSCNRAEGSSYSADNCYNAAEQSWTNCLTPQCTTKRVVSCQPNQGKLLQNRCEDYSGNLRHCDKIECEVSGGYTYTCAPTDQPSGDLIIRRVFGRIDAQTSEGNIDVNHCGGEDVNVTLSTSGGNVNVANCTGQLMLKTSGGNLNLNNLTGTINARSSGGDIMAYTLSGNITVLTSGGALQLHGVSGELSATSTGGTIAGSMTNVTGDIQLKSYRGNVYFTFPTGRYNLTITGMNVHVRGMNNFNGTQTKKSVKGQLNGGGTAIVVSGATVDIDVSDDGSFDDE
ncbi:hypothetical protein Ddc_14189 [Ditylenchus destructor]|nr:hypothetical protein Ddc_14189 [Ditylenchus destructor]